jgi:hypothetical protein
MPLAAGTGSRMEMAITMEYMVMILDRLIEWPAVDATAS